MFLRNLIFFILCISFIISCKLKDESSGNSYKEYELKHKQHCEIYLHRPHIQVADSFLIVVSHRQNDGICQLYSIERNMEMVCTYGKIGNGPKEFLQPVLTYATGNIFALNDLNLTSLAIMQIETVNDSISVRELKRMKAPYIPQKGEFMPKDVRFMKIGKEHYVSSLYAGNNRFFTLSDSLLQPVLRFGESPIKEELSTFVMRSRLGGKTAVHKNTFIFATNDLPYLASYSLQNDSMIKNWSMFYKKPYYGISNGDILYSKENTTGPMIDLKVDSQYIYVLYLDQLLSDYDYMDTEKSCSNKIFVFNHNGEKVACMNLDCYLSQIAVDSNRNKIYGIAENPETSLVEFDLPENL